MITAIILMFMGLFLLGIIFLADFHAPRTVALGSIYCIVILYTWLIPIKNISIFTALLCTLLIIIDLTYSPADANADKLYGINVFISVIVVWTCASLVAIAKRSFESMDHLNDHLEEKVRERTIEVRLNETRLRQMTEVIQDYAIILLSKEGKIENWNQGAQRILGFEKEEVHNKNYQLLFSKEDNGDVARELLHKASKNGLSKDESWLLRKSGEQFFAEITITAIKNDLDEPMGYSLITRDLTERKRAEIQRNEYNKQLEQKNKELEQFAYITSHDLQEPLLTVESFVNMLEEDYEDKLDDHGKKTIGFISKATKRMRVLIADLLHYSRIGSSKNKESINVDKLIDDLLKDFTSTINQTKASIQFNGLPTIIGYKMEVAQLFQNLISNAIKYQKKGVSPEVIIRGEEHSDHWKFEVKDNGIGIEQDYQERIFLIFQRLFARGEYEGTGIGLAHCKKIIELHRGTIWVESTPGIGSTFHFTINKNLS
ncbi:PAS domain S-box-containing protein [Ekhidna lutea]|uniref:histidine kinase n=2 Tax=Ekhidna lutea TaxID=447679 RepID=A0A239HZF1_EKHLU|nr:PAS domain S-box-containing protein [Ekhidna lutea]